MGSSQMLPESCQWCSQMYQGAQMYHYRGLNHANLPDLEQRLIPAHNSRKICFWYSFAPYVVAEHRHILLFGFLRCFQELFLPRFSPVFLASSSSIVSCFSYRKAHRTEISHPGDVAAHVIVILVVQRVASRALITASRQRSFKRSSARSIKSM